MLNQPLKDAQDQWPDFIPDSGPSGVAQQDQWPDFIPDQPVTNADYEPMLGSLTKFYGGTPKIAVSPQRASELVGFANPVLKQHNSNPQMRHTIAQQLAQSLQDTKATGNPFANIPAPQPDYVDIPRGGLPGATVPYSGQAVVHLEHGQDLSKMHQPLMSDLSSIASQLQFKLDIGTAITGHSQRTTTGNISRHTKGDAVDVSMINGVSYKSNPKEFTKLAQQLQDALVAHGYTKNSESGNQAAVLFGFNDPKKGGNHLNHVHISNRGGVLVSAPNGGAAGAAVGRAIAGGLGGVNPESDPLRLRGWPKPGPTGISTGITPKTLDEEVAEIGLPELAVTPHQVEVVKSVTPEMGHFLGQTLGLPSALIGAASKESTELLGRALFGAPAGWWTEDPDNEKARQTQENAVGLASMFLPGGVGKVAGGAFGMGMAGTVAEHGPVAALTGMKDMVAFWEPGLSPTDRALRFVGAATLALHAPKAVEIYKSAPAHAVIEMSRQTGLTPVQSWRILRTLDAATKGSMDLSVLRDANQADVTKAMREPPPPAAFFKSGGELAKTSDRRQPRFTPAEEPAYEYNHGAETPISTAIGKGKTPAERRTGRFTPQPAVDNSSAPTGLRGPRTPEFEKPPVASVQPPETVTPTVEPPKVVEAPQNTVTAPVGAPDIAPPTEEYGVKPGEIVKGDKVEVKGKGPGTITEVGILQNPHLYAVDINGEEVFINGKEIRRNTTPEAPEETPTGTVGMYQKMHKMMLEDGYPDTPATRKAAVSIIDKAGEDSAKATKTYVSKLWQDGKDSQAATRQKQALDPTQPRAEPKAEPEANVSTATRPEARVSEPGQVDTAVLDKAKVPLTDVKAAVTYGRELYKTTPDFNTWSQKMVDRHGDWIRGDLQKIYHHAQNSAKGVRGVADMGYTQPRVTPSDQKIADLWQQFESQGGESEQGPSFSKATVPDDLEASRREVSGVSNEILQEAARSGFGSDSLVPLRRKRAAIAAKIAEIKQNRGLPVEDKAQEERVISDVKARAERLGLDPNEAERYFRGLIEESKAADRADTVLAGQLKGEQVILDPVKGEPVLLNKDDAPSFAKVTRDGEDKIVMGMDPNLIKVLRGNLYKGDIGKIALKETLQNSVDAVRSLGADGKIVADVNTDNRTLRIADNGHGMLPDVVTRFFVDAGASVKQGVSSGGYGIAKVAFLVNAEKFNVISVAKDTNGHYIQTRLVGSGEDLINFDKGVDVQTVDLGTTGHTGTSIDIKFAPETELQSWYAEGFANDFANDHHLETNIDLTVNGQEFSKGGTRYKKLDHTATLNTPGARVEVHTSGDKKKTSTPTVTILNRGLPQFKKTFWMNEALLPKDITVDIHATVGVDSSDYPFTADRESIKDSTQSVIEEHLKQLQSKEADASRDKYQKAMDSGPEIGTKTSRVSDPEFSMETGRTEYKKSPLRLVDATQSLPQETLDKIAASPVVHSLADASHAVYNETIKALGTIPHSQSYLHGLAAWGTEGNSVTLGVNIGSNYVYPGQGRYNPILIDPFNMASISEAGPTANRTLAKQVVGTLVHEATHQIQRAETGMSYPLTDAYTRLIDHMPAWVDAIERALGPDGHTELNSLHHEIEQNRTGKSILGDVTAQHEVPVNGGPESNPGDRNEAGVQSEVPVRSSDEGGGDTGVSKAPKLGGGQWKTLTEIASLIRDNVAWDRDAWESALKRTAGKTFEAIRPHIDQLWNEVTKDAPGAPDVRPGERPARGEGPRNEEPEGGLQGTPEPGEATGLARQFEDAERWAKGKDPTPPDPVTLEQLDARGKHLIESKTVDPQKIVQEDRPLTPDETAAVTHWKRTLANERDDLYSQIKVTNDPLEAQRISNELDLLDTKFDQISGAAQRTRGYWHQGGMALQLAYEPDYSIADLRQRAKRMAQGEDLTPPQDAALTKHSDKIKAETIELASIKKQAEKGIMSADLTKIKAKVESLVNKIKEGKFQKAPAQTGGLRPVKKAGIKPPRGNQTGAVGMGFGGGRLTEEVINKTIRDLALKYRQEGAKTINDIMQRFGKDLPFLTPDEIYNAFDPSYGAKKVKIDAEKIAANATLKSIKRAFDVRRMNKIQRGLTVAYTAVDAATRSMKLIGHATAPGVQARAVMFMDPRAWLSSFEKMGEGYAGKKGEFAGGTPSEHELLAYFQQDSAAYSDARAVGFDKVLAQTHGSPFEVEEENLRQGTIKSVPGLGALSDRSSAAFNNYLNNVRWEMFQSARETAARLGLTGKDRVQFLSDMTNMIATTTGRSRSRVATGAASASSVAFAPRYFVSKWEYAIGKPFWDAKTPQARLQIAKMYARHMAGTAMMATVLVSGLNAVGIKASVDINPRSSFFGHLVVPKFNLAIDLIGGAAEPLKFMFQVTMGRIGENGASHGRSLDNAQKVVGAYVMNKLVPAVKGGIEMFSGKFNEEGEQTRPGIMPPRGSDKPPFPWWGKDILPSPDSEIANLSEPIMTQTGREAHQGHAPLSVAIPLNSIGISTRAVPRRSDKAEPRKNLLGGMFRF